MPKPINLETVVSVIEPAAFQIVAKDGRDLLTVSFDGGVTGALEDMGEAARLFAEELRKHIAARPSQPPVMDVERAARANAAWVDYEPLATAGAQTHRQTMISKHAFVSGYIAAMQSREG